MRLKNYKTSLTILVEKNKKSIFKKLFEYIKNPKKILPRILWEFKKHKKEINWNNRVKEMGNSAVFANKISIKEQNKLTKLHEAMLYKVLKFKVKKKSKLLDFGCGYGRFKKFFEKKLSLNYLGVEKEDLFLQKLNKKKFLSFKRFKNIKKYNRYFDIIFLWAVLGGFNNKNIYQVVKILKKKLSRNGLICFVEIVSKIEMEGTWRFRTINYYKNLFNGYNVNSDYYFLEDGQKKVFFLVNKY